VIYIFVYCVDTACAKNVLSGQWFNFDDSSVSAITEESVVVSSFTVIVSLYLLSVFCLGIVVH